MLAMNKTVDEIRREAFDAFAMNNMAAAIEAFEKYLAQKSDDALACSTLGNALKREGRFGEAVCRHQEALRLQPDSAELHSNIGATYLAWGQWSAAIRSFQTAISLEPSRLEFVFNLGTALHTTGDFGKNSIFWVAFWGASLAPKPLRPNKLSDLKKKTNSLR